ncbi:MAG TPA: anti-sigma factor [Mycobacteriales bacterium]
MDPDQLSLLALGESVDHGDGSVVSGHLRQCGRCRGEFESLQHTADLAREAVQHRDVPPPSEAVWSRIATEVGIGRPADPVPLPRFGQHRAPEPAVRRPGSRSRWVRPVATLVAAALIGVTGTLGALRPWRSEPAPATASAATLTAVTGGPGGASGRAVVERGPDGPVLRITAAGLPLQQGYYEVWVYDGKRAMVAIGVLGADSTASLPLPPTLDLRTYHVVDISQEQYDGDQTHSQTSVLRGSLTE